MDLNHRPKIWAGAMVLLAVIFSASTHAGAFMPGDRGPDKPYGMRPHPMSPSAFWQDPKVAQDLGLSDEQVRQLRDADFLFKERHLELKVRLDRLHVQMEKATSAETVDEALVRETAQKIAGLIGKLFVQDVESHLATEKILSSEQRKKMKMLELGERPKGMGPPIRGETR
jgi:Spy/CpxP family protein refolding chaperone